MNKKERMLERITRHGEQLAAIFPNAKKQGYALCAELRKIEQAATRNTTALCNGCDLDELKEREAHLETLEHKTRELLGVGDEYPLFINRDPRGYALKIEDEAVRAMKIDLYRDWGGYGILAPDLSND